MKKYLIIAAAALAAVSACTKNELDSSVVAENEINFEVANYSAQTKSEDNTVYSTSGKFGTFAWQVAAGKTWSGASSTDKSVFMNNVEIAYRKAKESDASASVWKAEKSYYWPKTGTITFASYSPYQSTGVTASDTDATITIAEWSVKTDLSTQVHDYSEDLLWATVESDKTRNVNTYGKSGVPTLFHHALTKVNLQAQVVATPSTSAYDYVVLIDNIAIKDILYKGKFQTGTTSGTWLPTSDKGSDLEIYKQTYTAPQKGTTYAAPSGATILKSTEATPCFSDYFVLPQTLSDDAVIEIKYTIITIDKSKTTNNIVLVENVTSCKYVENNTSGTIEFPGFPNKKYDKKPIQIKDMGLTSWDQNKNITYTITIVPAGGTGPNPPTEFTEIYFDPSVSDWSTASASGSIGL